MRMSDPRAPRLVQRGPSPAPHPQVGGFAAEYPTEAAALELLASGLPEPQRRACMDRLVATLVAEAEAPAWVQEYLEERLR
jgi:hypothetical protein